MQAPSFTFCLNQSKYLKAQILIPQYAAQYEECLQRAATWSRTALQKTYPHEYNSLRSRRASGKQFDPRLRDIRNWLVHLGPRPAEGWTVDEVVHGKGYVPNKCRWAVREGLQLENRKVTKWHLMPDGQRLLTRQFAQRLGITPNALRKQLRKGRTIQHLLDNYQGHRGLHAWQFPDALVHVLEPMFRKRTRHMQSRLEWFIQHLERQLRTNMLSLHGDEWDAIAKALALATEQRDEVNRRQEERAAIELRSLIDALMTNASKPA